MTVQTTPRIFLSHLAEQQRFRDYLGVDATSPQAFADVVQGLIRNRFLSFDLELPAADQPLLASRVRELAREEPDVAPLIEGCLNSEGLQQVIWIRCSRRCFIRSMIR